MKKLNYSFIDVIDNKYLGVFFDSEIDYDLWGEFIMLHERIIRNIKIAKTPK